jgi:hypothetical protein
MFIVIKKPQIFFPAFSRPACQDWPVHFLANTLNFCPLTFCCFLLDRHSSVNKMEKASSDRRAVLIFDWDDTIFPSSFIDKSQIEAFEDLPLHVSNRVVTCISRFLSMPL